MTWGAGDLDSDRQRPRLVVYQVSVAPQSVYDLILVKLIKMPLLNNIAFCGSMRMDLPWTEKYRPKNLHDIIGQKLIVDRLSSFVREGKLPEHDIRRASRRRKDCVCGCDGERALQGSLEGAFKELNASDERGIDVIRGTVKEFAKTISVTHVPIKIIFLDEADALTAEAQHALRRTMEMFAAETRFILSANYASKIIEPIQSRCVVFRFKPLAEEEMKKYITRIKEGREP